MTKIWAHYLKGAFFFDFLAISAWPLRALVRGSWNKDDVALIYLLRAFRISKLFTIMNLQAFTQLLRKYYRKRLITLIKKKHDRFDDRTKDDNEILQQIFIVKVF